MAALQYYLVLKVVMSLKTVFEDIALENACINVSWFTICLGCVLFDEHGELNCWIHVPEKENVVRLLRNPTMMWFTVKPCGSMNFLLKSNQKVFTEKNTPEGCLEHWHFRSLWKNCQDSWTLNEELSMKLLNYSKFLSPFQIVVHWDSIYSCWQEYKSRLTRVKKVTARGNFTVVIAVEDY